ncbi:hypothetical protein H2200_004104 [Cladophialophora chaetospira]|uniref:Uncharacterized protein n=1 Tax=Cladophialophora chaetospira TaxID=386627 RepID=A0AA38XFN4_9EURO|nr:hypothetical protein H2200_004104 [Cladophialophora chaetospira]
MKRRAIDGAGKRESVTSTIEKEYGRTWRRDDPSRRGSDYRQLEKSDRRSKKRKKRACRERVFNLQYEHDGEDEESPDHFGGEEGDIPKGQNSDDERSFVTRYEEESG